MPALPSNYYRSRRFWGILVVFSVLLGLFLARVVASYQRTDLLPQWNHAQWITSSKASAVTYYRKKFSLNALPEHAYIMLAATDGADLYINGKLRQKLERVSTAVYDIVDIGQYLALGDNTVAVRIERKTLNGAPALIARLRWQTADGVWHEIETDRTWRVVQREERQSNGAIAWYDVEFDDLAWQSAAVSKNGSGSMLYAEHPWADTALFNLFPRGAWMWEGSANFSGIGFEREFELARLNRDDVQSAWLGVASTVPYVIVINGARGPTIDPSDQYMDTYNIGDFLFSGRNTISIDISAAPSGGRVAVAAIIKTPCEIIDLSSAENWRARSGDQEHAASSLGPLGYYPYVDNATGQVFRQPVLRLANIQIPGGLLLRHLVSSIPWMIGVFALSLVIITVGFALCKQSEAALRAGLLPWILADILLPIAMILPFDVRITEADIFNLPVAVALSLFTPLLFMLTLSEVARGHRRNQ